MQQAQTCQTER